MVLTQSIGIGYLTANLFARRAPTVAASSIGFPKVQFLSTYQSLRFETKQRLLLPNKRNVTNILKHRSAGLSIREFSAEVPQEVSRKEEQKPGGFPGVWENEQWNLVVGFPAGMLFQSVATKMKFFYKCISAVIIPWATYGYTTGYLTMYYLVATYGSVLIAPLTLYLFSKVFNRMTAYILMEKSNDNILVGHFSSFLKLKQEVVPLDDILPETAATKMGRNIQGLVLTKKSNQNEWFYVPSNGIKIFDKEKAGRIFQNNLDIFPEEVYKLKKEE